MDFLVALLCVVAGLAAGAYIESLTGLVSKWRAEDGPAPTPPPVKPMDGPPPAPPPHKKP